MQVTPQSIYVGEDFGLLKDSNLPPAIGPGTTRLGQHMPTAWEIQDPWWVLGNLEIADVSLSKCCDTQDLQDLRSRSRAEKKGCAEVLAHVILLFLPPSSISRVKSEEF